MDFPIVDLIDDELSESWLLVHFHPDGLNCPHCGAGVNQARDFRETEASQLAVYRCQNCQGIYNLYSGTVLQGKHLRPAQAVLLLRGVCQGRSYCFAGSAKGNLRHNLRVKLASLAKR